MKKEEAAIISLFESNTVDLIQVDFQAGGDSVNLVEVEGMYCNSKEVVLNTSDFADTIIELVYDNVSFYETSDGHYMGESGIIAITYEAGKLTYEKEAQYEYSEHYSKECELEISKKEALFYNSYIENIYAYEVNSLVEKEDFKVQFKNNFFLNTENVKLLDSILTKIKKEVKKTAEEIEEICKENYSCDEFYSIDDMMLVDNKIHIDINYYLTEYRDE